jgi:hypothetical protein
MTQWQSYLALVILLGSACDGGGDTDPDAATAADAGAVDARDGFWLTGTVRAESGTIPVDGKLLAVWSVSDDEPRTGLHKRGEVLRSGATFEMPFAVPPDAAHIVPGLAVAILVHVDASAVVPDGDVVVDALPAYQGLSTEHAVIHRSGEVGAFAWADAFPLGFSCGRCVRTPDGMGHDHFEPAPCDDFEMVTGLPEDAGACNWN